MVLHGAFCGVGYSCPSIKQLLCMSFHQPTHTQTPEYRICKDIPFFATSSMIASSIILVHPKNQLLEPFKSIPFQQACISIKLHLMYRHASFFFFCLRGIHFGQIFKKQYEKTCLQASFSHIFNLCWSLINPNLRHCYSKFPHL